jgi:hypothetical protein
MKKKIVEHNEWNSFLSMIFRTDNWIRFVGAVVVYYGKKMPASAITSNWVSVQSDILLVILGGDDYDIRPRFKKVGYF